MKVRPGLHGPILLFAFICSGSINPVIAQDALPVVAASANYHDLTKSPGPLVVHTPAETRAKLIEDTIGDNWLSFRIALSTPDDPGQRQGFFDELQGSANPDAAKAYFDQVGPVYAMALDLVGKGGAAATDDDLARFVAAVNKMRAAEVKVSYDNPQPDGAELTTDSLKPVVDTKAQHVISDLSKLGQGGATRLNEVPAGQFKDEMGKLQQARIDDLVIKSGKTLAGDKRELSARLMPLVQQEINGALWQYREINVLLVSGTDHPDQTAMDVFNAVLDELHYNEMAEKALL